jgi:hypothetical protein
MPKRILIASELDQGSAVHDRLLPLIEGLSAKNHSIALAVRDPDAWLPRNAILAPAWQAPPPPGFLASTYADILLHAGYATPEALDGLLSAWLTLFARNRPDLLVVDFAPTAMLAARVAGLAVGAAGDGYRLPPLTEPLPVMRSWAAVPASRIAESEGRVLAVINAEMTRQGCVPLAALADLFEPAERFLCTFSELDHYPDRGTADYFGPVYGSGAGVPPDWPPGSAERFFVEIDGRRPLLAPLVEALDTLGLPSTIQASHLSPAVAATLDRPHVRVVPQLVDRNAALANCDVVACQSSGMVPPALLAGRPVLLLPQHVEQMMTLHRVAPQGLGHGLPADADATAAGAGLRRLLDDAACRQRAAGFARSYQGYRPSMAATAVVEELDALVADTG